MVRFGRARRRARALALLASLALFAAGPRPCRAAPQGNVGLVVGGAGAGEGGRFWQTGDFQLGLRGDVLLGRSANTDFGLGPYLELGTLGFGEIEWGGGASVLLPVHERLPLVVSAGGFGRYGDDGYGIEPGLAASIFWGSRSYNFHAGYVMAAGLLVGFRQSLGESQRSALCVGAQIDLAVLGLPLVMLLDLMRGPSAETAPVARRRR
ncbi:MAG: hypothetical protein HY744_33980 [Deltaproteobacteria bacterium]|nr:hypothetical protein [Deltaproteobacteria bacterium]